MTELLNLVDAPAVATPGFGLLSVAQTPADTERWQSGVQFESMGDAKAYSVDGWCRPALDISSGGTSAVQTITVTATGGTFTIGDSDPVAFDASAGDVEAVINGSGDYDADAVVTGDAGGPFVITWPDTAGPQTLITVDGAALTGTSPDVTVDDTTTGKYGGLTTPDAGVTWAQSATVTIYALFDCATVGYTEEQGTRLARQKLELGAPRALEAAIATGKDSASATITGQSFTAATELNSTAVALCDGIGQLDAWIGTNYDGRGVLHVPRGVPACTKNVSRQGSHLETLVGNSVAAGAGYLGKSKSGADPDAGEFWLFATGAVAVRQSPDVVSGDGAVMGRRVNQRVIVAERQYTVYWEAGVAAVLVKVI